MGVRRRPGSKLHCWLHDLRPTCGLKAGPGRVQGRLSQSGPSKLAGGSRSNRCVGVRFRAAVLLLGLLLNATGRGAGSVHAVGRDHRSGLTTQKARVFLYELVRANLSACPHG
jgi:hypothetical protein